MLLEAMNGQRIHLHTADGDLSPVGLRALALLLLP
jgi:hypothetical protein